MRSSFCSPLLSGSSSSSCHSSQGQSLGLAVPSRAKRDNSTMSQGFHVLDIYRAAVQNIRVIVELLARIQMKYSQNASMHTRTHYHFCKFQGITRFSRAPLHSPATFELSKNKARIQRAWKLYSMKKLLKWGVSLRILLQKKKEQLSLGSPDVHHFQGPAGYFR